MKKLYLLSQRQNKKEAYEQYRQVDQIFSIRQNKTDKQSELTRLWKSKHNWWKLKNDSRTEEPVKTTKLGLQWE